MSADVQTIATLHDFIAFRNKQYAENPGQDVVDPHRNIEIFSQILEGAAYIHEQGLIHRDLKPSNIFLSMPHEHHHNHHHHRDSKSSPSLRPPTDTSSTRPRRSSASSSGGCTTSTTASLSGGRPISLRREHDHGFSYDAVVEPDSGLRECMWDESWCPKIGDFGLAAAHIVEQDATDSPLQHALQKRDGRPSPRRMHTSGVGTQTVSGC